MTILLRLKNCRALCRFPGAGKEKLSFWIFLSPGYYITSELFFHLCRKIFHAPLSATQMQNAPPKTLLSHSAEKEKLPWKKHKFVMVSPQPADMIQITKNCPAIQDPDRTIRNQNITGRNGGLT
ncbi:MAG: hypothetical protein IJ601_00505 [Acidaminococcaceae bacterium]|nr:hypothetical protein [Acidaminococcaceae bacterium]